MSSQTQTSRSHLRINNLTVRYGDQAAIDQATFTVDPGELCVLVGPSGSGKSTILRAVAGFAPIERGEIYIGDTFANDLPPEARDIAMVFQRRALYPHMTVWENWAFPLQAIGESGENIRKRVHEIGEILQMSAFLNRYPRELSGGQQQRVAIGRALIRRPRIFLLDEPLSGLDAKLRIETRSYIRRLHGQLGATMVYVTHNHVEAQAIGDKIVMLHNNKVQQVGSPDDIYNHPANTYVAEYLGSPPINLIDCTAAADDDGVRIRYENHTWVIGGERGAKIRERLRSSDVILGVRAEDIWLYADQGEGRVPAEVYVTEPQGHEIIIDLSFESLILRSRQDRDDELSEKLDIGDPVYMGFDLARCHIFDRATGENLSAA